MDGFAKDAATHAMRDGRLVIPVLPVIKERFRVLSMMSRQQVKRCM